MSPVVLVVETKQRGVAAVTLDTDGDAPPALLPLESVVLHGIRPGASFDEHEWRRLHADGRLALATRRALDLLARRQRTEHELRRALARSFAREAVEGAVQRLHELGYLDDASWARAYVTSPRAADRGRAFLRRELRQRGVPDALSAPALAEHDDREAARAAALKRARSLRTLPGATAVERRLYEFLRRRGFSDGTARRAMTEALSTLDGGEPTAPGLPDGGADSRWSAAGRLPA